MSMSLSREEGLSAMQDALAALSNQWAIEHEGMPAVKVHMEQVDVRLLVHALLALDVLFLDRYEALAGEGSVRELIQQIGEVLVERQVSS